jgi:CO/xanthine dehydrogenase FAD-binding subunit
MDLDTVTQYRHALSRADLALQPGERIVAGGTWLFSEPQPGVTGLVDISKLPWPSVERPADGSLRIGATCTIAQLSQLSESETWPAAPLFHQCATALLASFKVWNSATVGGNICRAFAAAAMVSLAATLDATAEIWHADGTDSHQSVTSLITGNGTTNLSATDVLRSISFPAHALQARTAFRQISLANLGRSGAVLTGRRDTDDSYVFVVTAATLTPQVLRYPQRPAPQDLHDDVHALQGYYTDPMGAADWRRSVSGVLMLEVLEELS